MIQTLDPIIFTREPETGTLMVLLYKRPSDKSRFPNSLSLPGGWIFEDKDTSIDGAMTRILTEKVGFTPKYMESLSPVGNAYRDPDGWSVTIPYLCLSPYQQAGSDSHWADVDDVIVQGDKCRQPLPFDHNTLITKAFQVLKHRAAYSTIPVLMMPELFTLAELQQCCESILGQNLFKTAFKKRWVDKNIISATEEKRRSGNSKRPATLYQKQAKDILFFERVMTGENE